MWPLRTNAGAAVKANSALLASGEGRNSAPHLYLEAKLFWGSRAEIKTSLEKHLHEYKMTGFLFYWCSHLTIAAAQFFRLGRVRRVDSSLVVNNAVTTVTRFYYLHQLLINRAQRVHTYKQKQKHHLCLFSLIMFWNMVVCPVVLMGMVKCQMPDLIRFQTSTPHLKNRYTVSEPHDHNRVILNMYNKTNRFFLLSWPSVIKMYSKQKHYVFKMTPTHGWRRRIFIRRKGDEQHLIRGRNWAILAWTGHILSQSFPRCCYIGSLENKEEGVRNSPYICI